jgi:hypothetical protein
MVEPEEGIGLEWIGDHKMAQGTSGACTGLHAAEWEYVGTATGVLHVMRGKVAPKRMVEGHSKVWEVLEARQRSLGCEGLGLGTSRIAAPGRQWDAEW